MNQPIDFMVLEQAAEWFALLRSEGLPVEEHARWQAWLEARPQHRLAWQRVEAISRQFEGLAQPQVARQALQAQGLPRRQALKMLSLLGASSALLLAGRALPWQQWQASQRTAVGEVREARLADGSRLWLNTDSAVELFFSAGERRLALYRGELLIEAPADSRPLLIDTAQGRLRAAAGRFGVHEREHGTQVAAYAGSIELLSPAVRIAPGQQRLLGSRAVAPQALDSARQAWTRGVLQADDMRLGDFITELGRYQPGYLGCDPRVAELRLVGAFPLAERERIFSALEASLPVRVVRRLPWWISVEPREAAAT